MVRYGAIAAVLVLAADQASKWWVLNVLHLPELGSVPLLPVLNLTITGGKAIYDGTAGTASPPSGPTSTAN